MYFRISCWWGTRGNKEKSQMYVSGYRWRTGGTWWVSILIKISAQLSLETFLSHLHSFSHPLPQSLAWFFSTVLTTIQNYLAYLSPSYCPSPHTYRGIQAIKVGTYQSSSTAACTRTCYIVKCSLYIFKNGCHGGRLRKEQEEAKIGIRPRF